MDDEQTFLVDAQKERDKQVAGGDAPGYEPDPALQDAIDAAEASGSDPGSEEPGLMGMGGLSKSEIEVQKQDIAQRKENVGTP